jgi:hypothetical protein
MTTRTIAVVGLGGVAAWLLLRRRPPSVFSSMQGGGVFGSDLSKKTRGSSVGGWRAALAEYQQGGLKAPVVPGGASPDFANPDLSAKNAGYVVLTGDVNALVPGLSETLVQKGADYVGLGDYSKPALEAYSKGKDAVKSFVCLGFLC